MSIGQILFSFEGRLRRRDFWLSIIGVWAFVSGLRIGVPGLFFRPSADLRTQGVTYAPSIWAIILIVVLMWVALAIYVKRCHRRDKSGWWLLMLAIPVFGIFWWFVELGLLEGTPGPN